MKAGLRVGEARKVHVPQKAQATRSTVKRFAMLRLKALDFLFKKAAMPDDKTLGAVGNCAARCLSRLRDARLRSVLVWFWCCTAFKGVACPFFRALYSRCRCFPDFTMASADVCEGM